MRTTFLCVTWRASSSSRLKRRSTSAAVAGVGHDFRADHLDRDGDAELGVPRLVDRAHAAHAEHADDVIAGPECPAGRERSGFGECVRVGERTGAVTVWRGRSSGDGPIDQRPLRGCGVRDRRRTTPSTPRWRPVRGVSRNWSTGRRSGHPRRSENIAWVLLTGMGFARDHSTPLCNTRERHAAGDRAKSPIAGSYSRVRRGKEALGVGVEFPDRPHAFARGHFGNQLPRRRLSETVRAVPGRRVERPAGDGCPRPRTLFRAERIHPLAGRAPSRADLRHPAGHRLALGRGERPFAAVRHPRRRRHARPRTVYRRAFLPAHRTLGKRRRPVRVSGRRFRGPRPQTPAGGSVRRGRRAIDAGLSAGRQPPRSAGHVPARRRRTAAAGDVPDGGRAERGGRAPARVSVRRPRRGGRRRPIGRRADRRVDSPLGSGRRGRRPRDDRRRLRFRLRRRRPWRPISPWPKGSWPWVRRASRRLR